LFSVKKIDTALQKKEIIGVEKMEEFRYLMMEIRMTSYEKIKYQSPVVEFSAVKRAYAPQSPEIVIPAHCKYGFFGHLEYGILCKFFLSGAGWRSANEKLFMLSKYPIPVKYEKRILYTWDFILTHPCQYPLIYEKR